MSRRPSTPLRTAGTLAVVVASFVLTLSAVDAGAAGASAARADASHLNGKRISARTAMPVGNLRGWRQVFRDNFAGTKLNTTTTWSAYNRGAPGSNPVTGWWMANHAVVSHGMLTLKGSVDRAADPAGIVVTAGVGLWKIRPQTYGKYEVLARMDKCSDVKYAFLLWPYSGRWPGGGEIDFAEDEGGSRASTTASLIYANRLGASDALAKDHLAPSGGLSSWHVLGVEWTPKSVRYTIDGHYWGKAKTSHVPHQAMTLVLQTEGKKLHPDLGKRSCNAQIGWVTQYAMSR